VHIAKALATLRNGLKNQWYEMILVLSVCDLIRFLG